MVPVAPAMLKAVPAVLETEVVPVSALPVSVPDRFTLLTVPIELPPPPPIGKACMPVTVPVTAWEAKFAVSWLVPNQEETRPAPVPVLTLT